MANRNIVAVFKLNGTKYSIIGDTIVDIVTSATKYESVRVTGISKTHDALRVISPKDGMNEIPIRLIKSITDVNATKNSSVISGVIVG